MRKDLAAFFKLVSGPGLPMDMLYSVIADK